MTLQYEMQTPRIKQFYRRDFVYLSQLLYALNTYREIRGVEPAKIDAAEMNVGKKLDAVMALMKRTVNEAETAIRMNNHEGTPIDFAYPVCYKAPIISPYAREYLEVLVAADDAFKMVNKAWLLGLIDPKQRSQKEFTLRKAIRAIAEVVRLQRIEMAKHVRSIRAQADEITRNEIDAVTSQEAANLLRQGQDDAETLTTVSAESDLKAMADGAVAQDEALHTAAS